MCTFTAGPEDPYGEKLSATVHDLQTARNEARKLMVAPDIPEADEHDLTMAYGAMVRAEQRYLACVGRLPVRACPADQPA